MAKAAPKRDAATRPSPEALYTQLGYLVASMPDLLVQPAPESTEHWLAKAFALVSEVCDEPDTESLRRVIHSLQGHYSCGFQCIPPTHTELKPPTILR